MELVNDPVPVPSAVWLSDIVGSGEVLQQIPLAVTVASPSEVTFPPLAAEFADMEYTGVVVTVG